MSGEVRADPAPGDDDHPAANGFASRLREFASVVAPTSVLATLLLYFGYVATLARFRYFGVYLDMVDLSTQQLILYGVEVAYVPVVLVGLAVLAALAVHGGVRWLLSNPARGDLARWCAVVIVLGAVLLFLRAIVGIIVPRVSALEFPGTTPIALLLGAILAGYGMWMIRLLATGGDVTESGSPARRPLVSRDYTRAAQAGLATTITIGVAGLFWAANTFASAYGNGRAQVDAGNLASQPEVILDTRDRLYGIPPNIQSTEIPQTAGSVFHYRYRGLRLLVATSDRLFLVPAPWSASSRTIVLAYNSDIRIQLAPEDERGHG